MIQIKVEINEMETKGIKKKVPRAKDWLVNKQN